MKREIKFRAFIKPLGIMVESFSVHENANLIGMDDIDFRGAISDKFYLDDMDVRDKRNDEIAIVILSGEDYIFIENKHFELMQFTGLLDKNDNEIFEGDIVASDYANGFRGVVHFELQAGCYWIKWTEQKPNQTIHRYNNLSHGGLTGSDTIRLDRVEILGNKYENPELVLAVAGSDLKPISSGGILP